MHSFLFFWTRSLSWTAAVTLGSFLLVGAARAESPVERTHKLIETFKIRQGAARRRQAIGG